MKTPAHPQLQRIVRQVSDQAMPTDDATLLRQFVELTDPEAFASLMARHGPMVLGTARRLVNQEHDAEDVFQAVFLSLARLAASIRHGQTVPAWLHSATYRIAAKCRGKTHAQRLPSAATAPVERLAEHATDPSTALAWREVRQALDEELLRLPEALRAPLLLCYLSGYTRDEAARELGWSLGTLKRRLEEGRTTLRQRLERRGISAAGLALAVLAPESLQATVPATLLSASLDRLGSAAKVPASVQRLAFSTVSGGTWLLRGMLVGALAMMVGGFALFANVRPKEMPIEDEAPVIAQPAAEPPADKPRAADQDPLPQGSSFRLGSTRFRLGLPIASLTVSPDESTAIAVNSSSGIGFGWGSVFDLKTGHMEQQLTRLAGEAFADNEPIAFTPDGKHIVTKERFNVQVIEAATTKLLRTFAMPQPKGSYHRSEWIAVTPDGKKIATTSQGSTVHLLDFETGETIRDFPNANPESIHKNGFDSVLTVAFTADGKRMVMGGYYNLQGDYFARLVDLATGKELVRYMHGKQGYGVRTLAISPDGKTLATGADEPVLRLFDLETGNLIRAFPRDGGSRMYSVAFSPDGKTVAAGANSVRLYDVATGEERLKIDRRARGLRFVDGGKNLVGAVSGTIERWEVATGKSLIPDGADSSITRIFVNGKGDRVVTLGQESDVQIWDASHGTRLRTLRAAWQRKIAMSGDGKYLVWSVPDKKRTYTDPNFKNVAYEVNRLQVYDIEADRVLDRFADFQGDATEIAFVAEDKKLVTVDHRNGMVRVWDFATGKEEGSFHAVREKERKQSQPVWQSSVSPDGKLLAVGYVLRRGGEGGLERLGSSENYPVRVWDLTTGKELHEFANRFRYLQGLAFSPDGQWVVGARGTNEFPMPKPETVVWSARTGKDVVTIPTFAVSAVFSPDGRHLATGSVDGIVQLWETASWSVRSEHKGQATRINALSFAPTGSRLYSGGLDTSVLAWDTRIPVATGSGDLASAWTDLESRDARRALLAQSQFLAGPGEAIKIFSARIPAAEAIDPKRIERWIDDLDAAEFATRDAATTSLQNAIPQTGPLLEKRLAGNVTVEVRQRITQILSKREEKTPAQLRQIRAVHIMEQLGTAEAKALLQTWASGYADAELTRHANQTLRRLVERTEKGPG